VKHSHRKEAPSAEKAVAADTQVVDIQAAVAKDAGKPAIATVAIEEAIVEIVQEEEETKPS
jgi:hypothetical protein